MTQRSDVRPDVRQRRLRRIAVLAVALATVGAASACSSGNETTGSAATAKDAAKVRDAATAMRAAPSFRFDAAVGSGTRTVRLAGEFTAPDRVHQVMTTAGSPPIETISIGAQTFVKNPATGQWSVRGAQATGNDPRSAFDAIAGVTDVSPQGAGYRFSLAGDAAAALVRSGGGNASSAKVDGTVQVDGGKLRQLVFSTGGGPGVQVSIAYSDIGSTPPVTAPAV